MRLEQTRTHLAGRAEERARIDRLLEEARGGRSDVLLVCGEPGIGKSVLLDYAVASAAGMRVLRARGLESESELAFAGLHELIGRVLDAIDEIPEPQAVALRGALRLAPVVEIDRFAIAAATLSLLGSVAERAPLLAIVDDAQWLDSASAEAIVFAARRFGAEGALLLAACRDGDESPFLRAGFAELHLAGLDRDETRELLEEVSAERVSPQVVERLLRTTGGNPLALLELTSQLTSDELAGLAALSEPLPVSRSIEQAFARRLDELSPTERAAVLVAASSQSERLELILPAAAALGAGPHAFEAAETAGLVQIDEGMISFRHPLLRSTIYSAATPAERREAHRALAEAIPDEEAHERVWHEAAATIAPDEGIASRLERTAENARRRSGYAAAARALERAARLTPAAEERARRLLAAGASARRAGLSWTDELLREALDLTSDPVLRFDIELERAAVEVWSGSVVAAARRYVESAERLDPPDPRRQIRALSFGAACWGAAGEIQRGVETARRAAALAAASPADEETRPFAAEALGSLLIEHGETEEGRELVLASAAWYEEHDVADADFVSLPLLWLEEYDLARRLIEALVSSSRRASDLRALPGALELLAELELRVGDWATATTAASESVRLAEETGQTTQLAYSLACLATVQAGRGDAACRAHAARAIELAERSGLGVIVEHAHYALGLLELGLGAAEAAVSALERAAAHGERSSRSEPGVFPWGPELAEAHLLSGHEAKALTAVESFERQALATGRLWARAAAARCRGLLAGDNELDALFLEALRLHENARAPFQRARTELAYGRRLRRARRRVDAREQLRRAIATFERLGAHPWLEAARRELAASGETLRASAPDARDLLTPQELQISRIIAGGMTNREAAASLFLSPKTIESHLQNAYRKLGVHSRTQLARRLQESGLLA